MLNKKVKYSRQRKHLYFTVYMNVESLHKIIVAGGNYVGKTSKRSSSLATHTHLLMLVLGLIRKYARNEQTTEYKATVTAHLSLYSITRFL